MTSTAGVSAVTGPVETDRDRLPRYAFGADGWRGFDGIGIEVGPAGELQLQRLPDAGAPVGPEVPAPAAGDAPAGVALDRDGNGFVSDPAGGRVLISTGCTPVAAPAGEVLGSRPGDRELLPGLFGTPRGLLLGPRGRLYVADAGADCVWVLDLVSGAVTGRWTDVRQPCCLAGDAAVVYVLDRGGPNTAGRVQRFDADGVADTAFAAAVAAVVADPVRLALLPGVWDAGTGGDGTGTGRLLIVDRPADGGDRVVPVVLGGAADGSVDAATAGTWAQPARRDLDSGTGAIRVTRIDRIAGIAAGPDRVYLVDAAHHDLVTVASDGDYIGSTRPTGPIGAVAAANGCAGAMLWTTPTTAGRLQRHDAVGARIRVGRFVCGPLDTATQMGRRELRANVDLPSGSHLQLWTAVTPGNVAPSPASLPGLDPTVPLAVGAPPWAALPADTDAGLVVTPAGPQLWLGGQLAGDGASSPSVRQLGVAGDRGWLGLLPAVYRRDPVSSDFLDRFLRLLHSVSAEVADENAQLVRRFDAWTADDPVTTPSASTPSVAGSAARSLGPGALDVLAGWLQLTLNERWAAQTRRAIVAGAFAEQERRGTPAGLTAAIAARFGAHAQIRTPAQHASIWQLPDPTSQTDAAATDGSVDAAGGLGFDTMLVAGPADGAVVGASAVVGQASLTAGVDSGAPLFDDLAHRFHVRVRADQLNPGTDDADVRVLIDEQKPAHTGYTLCLIGPRARVGMQARIGIDTIVAGPPKPLDLDGNGALDLATAAPAAAAASSAGAPPPTTDSPAPAYLGRARLGAGRLS